MVYRRHLSRDRAWICSIEIHEYIPLQAYGASRSPTTESKSPVWSVAACWSNWSRGNNVTHWVTRVHMLQRPSQPTYTLDTGSEFASQILELYSIAVEVKQACWLDSFLGSDRNESAWKLFDWWNSNTQCLEWQAEYEFNGGPPWLHESSFPTGMGPNVRCKIRKYKAHGVLRWIKTV